MAFGNSNEKMLVQKMPIPKVFNKVTKENLTKGEKVRITGDCNQSHVPIDSIVTVNYPHHGSYKSWSCIDKSNHPTRFVRCSDMERV